jgi:hypothetical protein
VKEATSRRRLLASDTEDTGFTPISNPLFSDKRLKKDIQTIQNASEKLQNIRGVTYYFDENIHTKDIKHLPEKEQIGVIAQEVEKVLPQVVTENDNGIKKVDYSSLTRTSRPSRFQRLPAGRLSKSSSSRATSSRPSSLPPMPSRAWRMHASS